MNNCKVILECQGEQLNVTGENVSVVDMATLLGYFACFVAAEAVKRGMPSDDIKDNMLDIFLAATANLES